MKVSSPLATAARSFADDSLTAFDYHPLTRVVFGTGSVARLGELARDLGGTRVLLVTDPGVTVSQPAKVTAITGIDALAHAVETYVSTRRNPLSQMYAHAAWRMLEPNVEKVLRTPGDLEARGAMQLGANFAGTAIENSM